jgi:hypothetical protein
MAEKKSSKKKTTKKKSIKKKENSEKICETFEVEKKGNEETVTKCGNVEKKSASKKQLNEQNKTLLKILIGLGLLVIVFIVIMLGFQEIGKFTYENTKFEMTKEGSLLLYKTSLPVYYQKGIADYNFYLRKDPRKTGNSVEFDGELKLLKNFVINLSDIKCNGDEIIGIANMIKLWSVIGANVMKDENATCDEQGRYIYLDIREGEETKIIEQGDACYKMTINNCEILEATERFMLETFVEVNKIEDWVFSLEQDK